MADIKQILNDSISTDENVVQQAIQQVNNIDNESDLMALIHEIRSTVPSITSTETAAKITDLMTTIAYNQHSTSDMLKNSLAMSKVISGTFPPNNELLNQTLLMIDEAVISNKDNDKDVLTASLDFYDDLLSNTANDFDAEKLYIVASSVGMVADNTSFGSDTDHNIAAVSVLIKSVKNDGSDNSITKEALSANNKLIAQSKNTHNLTTQSELLNTIAKSDKANDDDIKEVLKQANAIILSPLFDKATNWSKIEAVVSESALKLGLSDIEKNELIAKIEASIDDGKKDEIANHLDSIIAPPSTEEEAEIDFGGEDQNNNTKDWRQEEKERDEKYAEDNNRDTEHQFVDPDGLIAVFKDKSGKVESQFEHETKSKLKVKLDPTNKNALQSLSAKLDNSIEMGFKSVNLHGDINSALNQAIIKLAEEKGMDVLFEGVKQERSSENEPNTPENDSEKLAKVDAREKRLTEDHYLVGKWGGDIEADKEDFIRFKVENAAGLIQMKDASGNWVENPDFTAFKNGLPDDVKEATRQGAEMQIEKEMAAGTPLSEYKYDTQSIRLEKLQQARKEWEDAGNSAGAGSAEANKFDARKKVEEARKRISEARKDENLDFSATTNLATKENEYVINNLDSSDAAKRKEVEDALKTIMQERKTRG